ncbi:methyltransferase domain-containing protein [Candidatus Woesearchaeota archaeon]|nr:methyltransferase domain-containing protein [Candidatus Woesearchaeota archaeon]
MRADPSDDAVFPSHRAHTLDGAWRKALQHPRLLLRKYVRPGMTVLDCGCGPGFFTIELARMVGPKGRVLAVDLQQAMLDRLAVKAEAAGVAGRILLHRSGAGSSGVSENADLILAFYLMHEVPDQGKVLWEFHRILKPGGTLYLAEPAHRVSADRFQKTLSLAGGAGFVVVKRPLVLFSRAAVLRRSGPRARSAPLPR